MIDAMDKKSDWKNKGHDLSLHVPSGVFYVRKSFKRSGLPNLFKSTGEKQLWKAKEKAAELITRHRDIHEKKVKTVAQVIEEFLRLETPKKRRARTQENHRIYFRQLHDEWGKEPISAIDEMKWTEWLMSFQARKRRRTFNDYAVYMNILLRYAYKRKYVTHLVKLPLTDETKESGRVLTEVEINRIADCMSVDTLDQFTLAYECVMRLREALNLRWEQVDLRTGQITLSKDDVKTGSRTGKGRSFIAPESTLARLRARFNRQGSDSPFVFPARGDKNKPQHTNKKAWERAKRLSGIKGRLRWHDLRHTALSHMLLIHRQPITLVSEFAGVSVRTLQRVYLHSSPEQTKAVAVLRIQSKKV